MNLEAEPILASIVNVIVGLLVSKGIIDSTHAPMLAQEINNILAALVTLGLGGYSIYKTVEAYKHKTTAQYGDSSSTAQPAVTMPASQVAPTIGTPPTAHTGLPLVPTK